MCLYFLWWLWIQKEGVVRVRVNNSVLTHTTHPTSIEPKSDTVQAVMYAWSKFVQATKTSGVVPLGYITFLSEKQAHSYYTIFM